MQPLPPPPTGQSAKSGARDHPDSDPPTSTPRPALSTIQEPSNQDNRTQSLSTNPAKKRKHRGGKKRRNRRQSFAAPPSESAIEGSAMENFPDPDDHSPPVRPGESFYKRRNNRSDESLDSDVLLDHRNQAPMRQRRESRLNVVAAQRAGLNADKAGSRNHHRRRTGERRDDDSDNEPDDRTPLIASPSQHKSPATTGYGIFRQNTTGSSHSSTTRKRTKSSGGMGQSFPKSPSYDINNPPSVPGSPHLNASMDDPMLPDTNFLNRSPDSRRNLKQLNGDLLIDIDRDDIDELEPNSAPPSPRLGGPDGMRHKRAMTFGAGGVDVCFPSDVMSEMGDDDFNRTGSRDDEQNYARRRRRKREWPQLWVLDEWSREEKEDRAADVRRAQRVKEPVMVEGRLRPSRVSAWHREENDAPYRFTYFNEEFEGTIHAQTISELVPHNSSFRELFIPEPPLLEDSSDSESEDEALSMHPLEGAKTTGMVSPKGRQEENGSILSRLNTQVGTQQRSRSQEPARINSMLTQSIKASSRDPSQSRSAQNSGEQTPQPTPRAAKQPKKPKYGPRPTFWLDVMSPTAQEMQVITSAFGIHPLTHEDIIVQEAREKVELFKNYYFINYRTFDQDPDSENYLEPINMYIVVFRYGILTFHFSQIPHPANVRRRIRQLTQHLILSADWISYAIIDDITDAYGPMIHSIEVEVDDIDEAILKSTPGAFTLAEKSEKKEKDKEKSEADDRSSIFKMPWGDDPEKRKDTSGYDMLRRVGETRKKVMSLYRLLGNKADVIKGFAKRCNEQWDVAPKTEIGLYLGDIQDHILTMTSNLSHYETLLSRAHSNYLAQVS